MKPVRTATSNFVWKGPTPDVADLHAEIDREAYRTTTVWTFSAEEREAIARGDNVALVVVGQHPPVALYVTDQQGTGEDAPENLARLDEWRALQAEART